MSPFEPRTWSDAEDALIQDACRTQRYPIKWLTGHPMFRERLDYYQLRHRARQLGMRIQLKVAPKVLEIIEEHVGNRSAGDIAQLINRKMRRVKGSPYYLTADDVRRWCSKMGWCTRPDRLTISEMSVVFHVHSNKILAWIRDGKLRAKRDPESPENANWRIKPIDVVRFLREHPWEMDGGYFDIPWLMALFEELWVQCSANMQGKTRNGRSGDGKKVGGDRGVDGEGED